MQDERHLTTCPTCGILKWDRKPCSFCTNLITRWTA